MQANLPPEIKSISIRSLIILEGRRVWQITGTVGDDYLSRGVTVAFTGMVQGTTQADPFTGVFSYNVLVPINTFGVISATAIDSAFAKSDPRSVVVQ